MRWLSAFFVAVVLLAACSEPSREELASLAAKGYYDHLARGEYEDFLQGKAGADSLPDGYREQLLVGYKQFAARLGSEHSGVDEVRVSNAVADSVTAGVNVFLILCFADSTSEEIVVPMVEQKGKWRMK